MVSTMDANIGRVVDHLDKTRELDNTFILFMSDNGAVGALLEALPVMGPQMAQVMCGIYYNSFENIGRSNNFTYYGPQWAQAATAPSRMYKARITDGGIRCPAFILYPSFEKQNGSIVSDFSTVMDILPTLLERAQTRHPERIFRGRSVLEPKGQLWSPFLHNTSKQIHRDDHVTGWDLVRQQAIRKGSWKAVFLPAPNGPEHLVHSTSIRALRGTIIMVYEATRLRAEGVFGQVYKT
ncbi:hypothetical protein EX895_004127 [Sporisorium graminicola]|uniref:Sulfatase N-terminal domain-containing protein n=1 Tax=Sporisorium graminicola TaxID=280036 RepID=A0A4V6ETP8_9BASI|nr:hypothetical protein EX895_004127 [Sporisorium graminicola]TKY87449.1 hypothetical protein EX895_004127 [Sporisorium graminicola]